MTALFLVSVSIIAVGCGSEATPAPTATPVPTATVAAQPAYWPTTGWRTSTPEQQGVDSQGLLNALQHVQDTGINLHSIMVIRNGYVVLEAYNQPYTAEHKFGIYSVTKSVTGALTGIALHEGYIKGAGAHVLDYFPGMQISNLDDRKQAITVDDLLTMRPGLNCADEVIGSVAPEQSPNWVNYILNLPMATQPGQNMIYCTAGVHLMSAVLTKATGMNAAQYAQPRLFDPLGITSGDVVWPSDPQGNSIGGYGIQMKPSDMAKLGLLYLNGGKWDGTQVVPEEWVQSSSRSHTPTSDGRGYGYLFWIYPSHYAAEGLGEQKIMVVKDRNMVVIMTAAIDWQKGQPLEPLLDNYIIPAAKAGGPLPENRAAYEALQAKVAYMANPVQPVAALNDTARRVSGKTYVVDKNDLGFDTFRVDFTEGSPVVTATLGTPNGTTIGLIGLDNIYRVTGSMDGNWSAFRGHWIDANTFEAREIQASPDIQEEDFRLEFTGDQLKMHVEETVFGAANIDLQGVMKK
jgi:CubicO group peptidase (beta-lactamase class C family)